MRVFVFAAVALLGGFVLASPLNEYPGSENDIDGRGLIDQAVNSTINNILANLTETIDVDSLPLDLGTGEVLSGHLDLANLKITGIKSLVADQISVNVLTLKVAVHLKITELVVNLKYDADLLLLQLVPLYGDGNVAVTLDDVEISINGKAKLGDEIDIKELAVGITLGDTVFAVTGLIDSPELSSIVTNALNDNFAKFINDNQEVITGIISPIILDIVKGLLDNNSTSFADYIY